MSEILNESVLEKSPIQIEFSDKICRVCLQSVEDYQLNSISEQIGNNNMLICNMITFCTITKVKELDNLPKKICLQCTTNLTVSYHFKQLCESSYETLIHLLEPNKHNIELESPSDDQLKTTFTEPITNNVEINQKTEFTQTDEIAFHYCEMCSMKFIQREDLSTHRINMHTDEDFKCGHCEKSYVRLNHLQRHIAISHSEISNNRNKTGPEIINQCQLCDRHFSRFDHLKRHMTTVHGSADSNTFDETKVKNEKIDIEDLVDDDDYNDDDNEEEDDDFDEENDSVNIGEFAETNLHSIVEFKTEVNESDTVVSIIDIAAGSSTTKLFENPFANNPQITVKRTKKRRNPSTQFELICKQCDNTKFSSQKEYSEHMDKVHKITKIFKCEQCEKTFSRSTHLKRHELTHLEVRPYSCTLCEKGFYRVDHLNLHMQQHSNIKPHICKICDKGFTRAEHLRRHEISRHSSTAKPILPKTEFCDICKKGFTTPKYLQIHMRTHMERTWPCKFCQDVFNSKTDLNEHQKLHVNERPFLCSECGLRFVRNDYLVIHMRRHKGEKPYKCKFCGKGFPRATDLTVHERYHTGEKTHLCTTCGKGFQRAYNLLVHMRVHTGEKPYECPHCDKKFAQGNDLKAHVRRHTGERYKCEICGEGFIQGYHLTQHKRNLHGIDMKSHIRRVEKFITPTSQQDRLIERQQSISDINIKLNPMDDGVGVTAASQISMLQIGMQEAAAIIKVEPSMDSHNSVREAKTDNMCLLTDDSQQSLHSTAPGGEGSVANTYYY